MATGTLQSRGIHTQDYSVTLESNDNVSPFSTYGTINLASDIALYGQIVSVVPIARSVNSIAARITDNGLVYVSGRTAETMRIRVLFMGG